MFRRPSDAQDAPGPLEAVEAAVARRFGLGPADLVMVSEETREAPATTVLFWKDGQRHRLKVFKPAAEVEEVDLPPAFLAPGLIDDDGAECC